MSSITRSFILFIFIFHIFVTQICFFNALPDVFSFHISKLIFSLLLQILVIIMCCCFVLKVQNKNILKSIIVSVFLMYFCLQLFFGSIQLNNGNVVSNKLARDCVSPISYDCLLCLRSSRRYDCR